MERVGRCGKGTLKAQEEAALEDLDRILEQCIPVDRLATLGTFVDRVGHEINNIATVLQGTTEIIGWDAEDCKPVSKERVDDLFRACRSVAEQGKAILRLCFRASKEKAHLVDVNEVALEVLRSMRVVGCIKHLTVECDLPDGPTQMLWNRNNLEQILINLCTNAVDALGNDPQGRIDLIVRRSADDEEIAISVADNGPGMTPDVAGRAFEPFYTTKPQGQGTGLGLPVVKRLVESLGGSISIETRPGQGTTVDLTLPSGK